MNIELEIGAAIAKVSLRTVQKDDLVRRICKVTFTRDFDDTIAAALGADAKVALAALKSHALAEVVIPLDSIEAKGTISQDGNATAISSKVEIPHLRGRRAKGVGTKDDTTPSLALEFEFDFLEAPWVFLGRNHTGWARLSLKTNQLELSLVGGGGDRKPGEPEPYVPGPEEAF
jgi:hypothetical protein